MELRNRNGITSVDLDGISFSESSGLTIDELSGHFVYNPKKIKLEKFSLKTPTTSIQSKGIALNYRDVEDLKDFVNAVYIEGAILPSNLDFKDLSYFIPSLKSIDRNIALSGEIKGSINNLNVQNLHLSVSPVSYFVGDVDFKGLTDLDNCLILLDIKNCQTSKKDLETPPYKFGINKLKVSILP